jgi:hypothetical protein
VDREKRADSIKVFVLNVPHLVLSFTHFGSTKVISTRPRADHARFGYELEMIGDRKTSDSRSVLGLGGAIAVTTPRAVLPGEGAHEPCPSKRPKTLESATICFVSSCSDQSISVAP